MKIPYKDIVIEQGHMKNAFGKPITFLGRGKRVGNHFEWIEKREIVLAIGTSEEYPDEGKLIGELKKEGDGWIWIWAIPLKDIMGYEDLVEDILLDAKKQKEEE